MKIKDFWESNIIKKIVAGLCVFNVLSLLVIYVLGLLVSSEWVLYNYRKIWSLYFFLTAIPLVLLFLLRFNKPPISDIGLRLDKSNLKLYRLLKYISIFFVIAGIISAIFLLLKYQGYWPMEDPKFRPGRYFLQNPRLLKPHHWIEVPLDVYFLALRISPALYFGVISFLNTLSYKAWRSKIWRDL